MLETGPDDDSRFDAVSALVLGLVALLTVLAVIQTLYRVSLPTDGWGFQFAMSGGRQQVVFDWNRTATPSPLQHGDVLQAIEDKPVETIMRDLFSLRSSPPVPWVEGQTVKYTVLRDGSLVDLDVVLKRLPLSSIPWEVGRGFLTNPSALASAVIALFVFLRRPGSAPARLLLIVCFGYFLSDGVSSAIAGLNVGPTELVHTWTFWSSHFLRDFIWTILIGPVYFYLFHTFPVTKSIVRYYRPGVIAVSIAMFPVMFLIAMLRSRSDALLFWPTWVMLSWVSFLIIVGGVAVATGHTLVAARNATHRAQIRWVALGVLVMSAGLLTGLVMDIFAGIGELPALHLIFHRMPMLAFPVSLAIAILRFRLFDIDLVINRTVVYALLTAVLALVYILSIISLQEFFQALTGQESNIAIAASTLAIAVLFRPVRSHLQRFIDRRFYRRRYDVIQTLASFGESVRDEVDLPALSERLVSAIEETVQPSHVSLWLRLPASGGEVEAEKTAPSALSRRTDGQEIVLNP
jgi:hypothetical protein